MNWNDCKEAFAVPGEDSLIDCVHPTTGRSVIEGETLEQIRLRYPGAEIINIEAWCAAKAARQDEGPTWKEVTEERFWEMLEVLPPAAQTGGGFLVGEPWDHHAVSGRPRYAAFIERGKRFFESSRPMTRDEFKTFVATVTMDKLVAA